MDDSQMRSRWCPGWLLWESFVSGRWKGVGDGDGGRVVRIIGHGSFQPLEPVTMVLCHAQEPQEMLRKDPKDP